MKALLTLLFCFSLVHAQVSGDVLRTVILDRINQFITYKKTNDDFLICIHKNKSLYKAAQETYKNRKYKNRNIQIVLTDTIESVQQCDLFYADDLSSEQRETLFQHKSPKTLLVTSNDSYLEDGFMVSLFLKNNKINFGINQGAIVESGLKVNYRLLQVASRVINMRKE